MPVLPSPQIVTTKTISPTLLGVPWVEISTWEPLSHTESPLTDLAQRGFFLCDVGVEMKELKLQSALNGQIRLREERRWEKRLQIVPYILVVGFSHRHICFFRYKNVLGSICLLNILSAARIDVLKTDDPPDQKNVCKFYFYSRQ